ncbi:MAG: polysaccharide deacetylase family protein [Burkholderiales bacterium]
MPIPILMYHQVEAPPPRGTPLRGLVVAPHTFAWQMRMLALLGYRGLSMRDLEPYLQGERRGRVVGITFDDGYRNNLVHALPVLQARGFSATCYVVSRALGGSNAWDAELGVPRKDLMDAADLRRWRAAGMDIGSHTRDHADLTQLDDAAAREQIAGAKTDLEQLLGTEVRHFCYPYGRFRNEHARMAAEAGYATATTVGRGRVRPDDDRLRLPRVLVSRSTHPGYFFLKLLTGYEDRYRPR